MIGFCQNAWTKTQEWTSNVLEQIEDTVGPNWNYYLKERAILKGLPVTLISTVAAAILFDCAKPSAGAIFGLVNYVTLTSLTEVLTNYDTIDNSTACVIVGITAAISAAFMKTICKTSMTYQTIMILAIASFGGQIARGLCSTDDY